MNPSRKVVLLSKAKKNFRKKVDRQVLSLKQFGCIMVYVVFKVHKKTEYRGIVQWQSTGLQNRRWEFESLYPCVIEKASDSDAFFVAMQMKKRSSGPFLSGQL